MTAQGVEQKMFKALAKRPDPMYHRHTELYYLILNHFLTQFYAFFS
jgi:hypothetical protein